jgi:hypothetical protein
MKIDASEIHVEDGSFDDYFEKTMYWNTQFCNQVEARLFKIGNT